MGKFASAIPFFD